MGTPFAGERPSERPREWLKEAYIVATQAHISDPLSLPVSEFNGWIRVIAEGEPMRSAPFDPRSYVDDAVRRAMR